MAVVEKTMDTAGGAVGGGVKGAIYGALTSVAIGALVVGGLMATAGAIMGGPITALGLGLAGALGGAVIGALPSFSVPLAGWGGAIGAVGGGAKGLMNGGKEREQSTSIEQQLAAEQVRGQQLAGQLAERQRAASSYSNPDATTGHAARAAAGASVEPNKEGGFVAKAQTAANDATVAQRA